MSRGAASGKPDAQSPQVPAAGLLAAGGAALLSGLIQQLLDRRPPPVAGWQRPNYAGRPVTLAGGAAAAAAAAVSAAASAGPRRRSRVALVAIAATAAGAYDDLVAARSERRGDKGGKGHLAALRQGRLSGGVVKAAVIGAGALAAAPRATSRRRRVTDAALIAGTANLLNLFDLRPGRALKVAGLTALPMLGGAGAAPAGAVLGAALAGLPGDLAEWHLLGDTGANPVGALLGLALSRQSSGRRRWALVFVVALTAASELVSFTRVIDAVPALRALDRWGGLGR